MGVLACLASLALLLQDPPVETLTVGGRKVTVRPAAVLPVVDSEYTKVFVFDKADNPKLKELREKNGLDELVAKGKDEFDKQVLLLDWVNRRIKKFGRPSANPKGALEILKAVDEGHTFFCAHYGDVMVSASAAFGWVDRSLALRRPDNRGSGSTEHTITEIWSNQYRKWVMMDPTFGMYVERGGQPLNAYEIRDAWFNQDAKDLVFVLGAERKRVTKADFPVFHSRHAGFGDLKLDKDCFDTYAFLGYIPNTNLMDAGPDYGRMFITQDKIGEGTTWHKRKIPKDPAHDPYFPIQQAALSLLPVNDGAGLEVRIKTMTPNFKTFRVRFDGKAWADCGEKVAWPLHAGANRIEVVSVNASGVEGPPGTLELDVAN